MPSVDVWATAADVRTADRWRSASANWNSALTQALLDAANLYEGNVGERHITLPRIWAGSPQDLWQYFQEVSPPFQPLVDAIPANRRSEVNAAVCVSLARFQSGATITIPVRVVLATAEK